jgi:hypothetical protein
MPQRIDLQGFGQDDLALSRKGTLLHPRPRENSAGGRLRWAAAQAIFPGKTSLYDETFQGLSWPTQ